MPPRLSKRQQRELEELDALKAIDAEAKEESDEDQPIPPSRKPAGFANLFTAVDSESDAEEETQAKSKSKKSKKKKKKPSDAPKPAPTEVVAPPNPTPSTKPTPPPEPAMDKSEKKALKRAKQKERKAGADEIDKALAELSLQTNTHHIASSSTTTPSLVRDPLNDLLAVSVQNLDADAELRRFFGSKVVQATRTEASSSSKRKVQPARSQLTRPPATWWPANLREGLSLRPLTDEELEAKCKRHGWEVSSLRTEKWWTVEYSKRYKAVTKVFLDTALSGDPQGFWDLLSTLPWHADTLLQLSEVYRHRDEHAQAVDFIDRGLFTYERAFFGCSFAFTAGIHRLDFDDVTNRPFFLALNRQTADLQRRGCFRTSFEFARLLYSLDPWSDPHGALLHLDFLAIKTGMEDWLLDVWSVSEKREAKGLAEARKQISPSVLPGWSFSRALALRLQEVAKKSKDHTASSTALVQAALEFPMVVPLLADKLDVSLPANVRSHSDFKIETDANYLDAPKGILHLLAHLYAQRCYPVWKDHADWFSSTIYSAAPTLTTSHPTPRRAKLLETFSIPNASLRFSIYRHVIVLESTLRRLFSFIPRDIVSNSVGMACDPLPPSPSSGLTWYDNTFFQGISPHHASAQLADRRSRRRREADDRRLAQLIPNPMVRQHFRAVFDANPALAQRFPGGLVQMAQMAAELNLDDWEEMMAIEAAHLGGVGAQEGGGGGMPGGFGDEGVDGDEGDAPVRPAERGVVELEFVDPPPLVPGQEGALGDSDSDSERENDLDEDEDDEEPAPLPMPARVLRNILGRFWGRSASQADDDDDNDEGDGDEDDEHDVADDLGVD